MASRTTAELLSELSALRARTETLERRQRELTALLQAHEAITSSLDLEQSLRAIVHQASTIAAGSDTWLYVLDEQHQVLRCRVSVSMSREEMDGLVIPVGEGIAGRIAVGRTPLAIADIREHPHLWRADLAAKHGHVAYLGLPVILGDQLLGVLAFSSPEPRCYTDEDVEVLTVFARQAAIAIGNGRLHEAAIRRGSQLEALLAAARSVTSGLDLQGMLDRILAEAARISGAPHVKVLLLDRAAGVLRVGALQGSAMPPGFALPVGVGSSGLVAQTGQPLYMADAQNDSRSIFAERDRELGIVTYLGLPIKRGDEVLGVLTFNTTVPRQYSPEELAYLTSFADQAAIAIENARLHGSALRRAEEMEALLRATRTVMGEVDLQRILDRIVTEAAAITQCSHVKVLLVDSAAQVLRVGALCGTTLPVDFQMPLGTGFSGRVAATGAPLYVEDPGNDHENVLARQDRLLGVATYLGLPIKIGNRVLGVLTFNTTAPRSYTAAELAFLGSFADHAAIALEKAQLFHQLHRSYANLERTQGELIQAEKLRALGQMSAGMAHDLNNILAAILGQVELLQLRAEDVEIQDRLRILETAATDAAQVVRRLQDFARQRGRSPLTPINLSEVVHESLEISRPRWKDELQRQGRVIEVQVCLPGLPPVLGYAPEVREVLTNVILNAVDAMPSGGTLSLTAQVVRAPEAESEPGLPDRDSARLVEVRVADTGVGMSEEVRQRVFDPFFTTKSGWGMGLGLSVVYGIMERHGGHIAVRSAPDQGTTVSLRFRTAPGGEAGVQQEIARRPPVPRRILVVDDDPMVRNTTVSLLRAAGHLVTEAKSGAAGIAQLADGLVDLVLTDLGMPEVTGWDVARAVRSCMPRLPVILLTGWGEHGTGETPPAGLVDRILAKPVSLNDLLAAIDELTAGTWPDRRARSSATGRPV